MSEINSSIGKLIGRPFMASVDCDGTREDRGNCVLVVHDFKVPAGYCAYIFDNTYSKEYIDNLHSYCPDASILYDATGLEELDNYDVVEVSEDGSLYIAYSDASEDNVLFITNRCNSNCIMCPDSDYNRNKDIGNRVDYLYRLIKLIPSDAPHLTITGGEPTLLKWDFIDLLRQCKEHLPNTDILMLSNGRSFCVKEYREAFLESTPERFRLAVPLYASNAEQHDNVTRFPGSFNQTMEALKHLQLEIELEIRIVVMSINFRFLPDIARFISRELPQASTVSFMGMELLGNAARIRDSLWVDYAQTASYIEQAARILIEAGIDAHIYNYPLCGLPRRLWSIASKSITDYKVRYKPECDECAVKHLCGGFFISTINYKGVSVFPVSKEKANEE